MYFIKPPYWVRKIYKHAVFNKPSEQLVVYLTFDDGPIPEITPWVLETLAQYKAQATFFCIGDNVRKYPEVFNAVKASGHSIGNHTFNHLNAWKVSKTAYLQNIEQCSALVNSRLFRPPYGKITPALLKHLTQVLNYEVILWDVLSADFDTTITGEQCYHNVMNNVQNGSIIIFHDSLKAEERLRYALPRVLKFLQEREFTFKKL
jgi:peptidoglycan/xylan/chitin deacetylase (PgdA/CDA1 family)